jgi:hypothetical protein
MTAAIHVRKSTEQNISDEEWGLAGEAMLEVVINCHGSWTGFDRVFSDYPVDLLRQFKARHESWVAESLYADYSAHIGPSAQFYRRLLKPYGAEGRRPFYLT